MYPNARAERVEAPALSYVEVFPNVLKRTDSYSNVPIRTSTYEFVPVRTDSYQSVPVFSEPKIAKFFAIILLRISAIRFVRLGRFFVSICVSRVRWASLCIEKFRYV